MAYRACLPRSRVAKAKLEIQFAFFDGIDRSVLEGIRFVQDRRTVTSILFPSPICRSVHDLIVETALPRSCPWIFVAGLVEHPFMAGDRLAQ